jgi:hypothetical protein
MGGPSGGMGRGGIATVGLTASVGLGLVVGGGLAASSQPVAVAAKASKGKIQILAPKDGAIRTAPSVLVRVRAKGKAFRFRAQGRDVTARFGKPVNGIRAARLVRGRDFGRGEVPLFAAVGRRHTPVADGIVFNSAEPRESLIHVKEPTRLPGHPVMLRARLSKRTNSVRVLLNGHKAPVEFPRRQRRVLRVPLGADEGLRHGRNEVRVFAHITRGYYDSESSSFKVSKKLALAGAGPERRTRPGQAVTLDGSASLSANPGDEVHYRWDLVRAPNGAKASITGSANSNAQFVADSPGVYVARLTVGSAPPGTAIRSLDSASSAPLAESARKKRGCAKVKRKRGKRKKCKRPKKKPSAPSATPATPPPVPTCNNGDDPFRPPAEGCPLPPPDNLAPAPENLVPLPENLVSPIQDLITIHVLETFSPMGYPIQTIDSDARIRYGNHVYEPPNAPGRSHPGNWVHMLVIDGRNGTPVDNRAFDIDQTTALKNAVHATSGSELVVLSGQGKSTSGWSKANVSTLGDAFSTLGGTLRTSGPTPTGASSLANGHWSIIGTNGLAEGQATQNSSYSTAGTPEIAGGSRGRQGSINGYVQEVLSDDYEYISPETIPIDTNTDPHNKTRNTIKVGDRSFTSETLKPGQSGFHLLVFNGDDPASEMPESKTFVTDLNDTQADSSGVKALADTLSYFARSSASHNKPPLLVLQSINRPHAFDAKAWVNDNYGNDDNAAKNQASQWFKNGNTVAGAVGVMAGPAAHDQVANLGHDDTYVKRNGGKGVLDHNGWVDGGYTLIGSPFDPDKAEVLSQSQAGSGGADARVVGSLARNKQSQWIVRNPGAEPAFDPNELMEIAFQPAQPWKTGATDAEQEADAYIARIMFKDNPPPSLRSYYQFIGQNWGNRAGELTEPQYDYPADGKDPVTGAALSFNENTYDNVRSQLETEMRYADDVRTAILNFQSILGAAKIDALVNQTTLANSVIDSIEPPLKKSTILDPTAIASEFSFLVSSLAVFAEHTPAGPAAVATAGTMGAAMGLLEAAEPKDTASGGTPLSQQISDQAGKLAADVTGHYSSIGDGLTHMYALMVSDWGKLQRAEAQSGIWNNAPQDLLEQTFATSAKQEFVKGLSQVAYHQYRIHPAITSANGTPARAETYKCIQSGWGLRLIFNQNKAKNAAVRAGRLRWTPYKQPGPLKLNAGDGAQGSNGWIMGEALAEPVDWGNEENGIFTDFPGIPPVGLMSQAFSPVQQNTGNQGVNPAGNPGPLQMDKSAFFGDSDWRVNGVTCANEMPVQ